MSRTGGEKTRARIMAEAQRLFAANGYAQTSVDDIAGAAQVNKALIYYYFKSKQELLNTIFKATFDALEKEFSASRERKASIASLCADIKIAENRKQGIGILLMEALRGAPASDFLLQAGEFMAGNAAKAMPRAARLKALCHEFYTGVVPYMMFLTFKDKWCARYNCTPEQAARDFAEVFMKIHITKK